MTSHEKSWTDLTTMEQHRMLNDDRPRAEKLRALSKNADLPSAKELELARLAEKQIADLGTMGLHRLLNDEPKAALALFEWAAKVEPDKYAGRIASLRARLGA